VHGAVDEFVSGGSLLFGDCRLDRRLRTLFRRDETGEWAPVAISQRALEILAVLLRSPGDLVSKTTLMEAVWPEAAVEANNLTVHIASLRRALDAGRSGDSCIQTVPGRGYRFVLRVSEQQEEAPLSESQPPPSVLRPTAPAVPGPVVGSRPASRLAGLAGFLQRPIVAVAAGAIAAALFIALTLHVARRFETKEGPPLSIVVLPFENLSGDKHDDYLADAITDDLTSDLSHISGAFVIAHESANTFKGQTIDVKKVGQELGVRYMLDGSVRKIADILRVNAQLIDTKTGAELWSDRFDQSIADLDQGQEETVRRLGNALGVEMIQAEAARSERERPNDPVAFDLVLRARSLRLQPPSAERLARIVKLYRHASQLDPSSVPALAGLAESMIEDQDFSPRGRKDMIEETAALLERARTIDPASESVQAVSVHWLQRQDGRCRETVDAARSMIETYPNHIFGYRALVRCLSVLGKAEEAIPLIQTSLRLNPRDPWRYLDYARMGHALALLGRFDESILWNQRALAANPDAPAADRAWYHRLIAEALALTGRTEEAHQELVESLRLWPYTTVREEPFAESSSPVYTAQLDRLREGARLAGLRDHANEDADFGIPPDHALHQTIGGLTPTTLPGATTIRTEDLSRLLADHTPLVLDTMLNFTGQSLPNAVGLRYAGGGGDLTDLAQGRMRAKIAELTKGDLAAPIVVVGWNCEHFDGRNLALRLTALGYSHVYWYRGGREAWEVDGLPEAPLIETPW
jgi:adenylate cyclase